MEGEILMTAFEEYCDVLLSQMGAKNISRQLLGGFLQESFHVIDERTVTMRSNKLFALQSLVSDYVDFQLDESDSRVMYAFSMGIIKAVVRLCELFAKSVNTVEHSLQQLEGLSNQERTVICDAILLLRYRNVYRHKELAEALRIDKARLSQLMGTENVNKYFIINQVGREKHYSLSSLGINLSKILEEEKKGGCKPIKQPIIQISELEVPTFFPYTIVLESKDIRNYLDTSNKKKRANQEMQFYEIGDQESEYYWSRPKTLLDRSIKNTELFDDIEFEKVGVL